MASGGLPPGAGGYQAYDSMVRFSYASLGSRFVGMIVEGLATMILPVIAVVLGLVFGETEIVACTDVDGFRTGGLCEQPTGGTIALFGGVALVLYLLSAFFFVVKPTATTGQSIAGRMLGYKVVDGTTGAPIGYLRVLGRMLIAGLASGNCCYLGYIWAFFQDRKQTWHDMIVSSVVVDA